MRKARPSNPRLLGPLSQSRRSGTLQNVLACCQAGWIYRSPAFYNSDYKKKECSCQFTNTIVKPAEKILRNNNRSAFLPPTRSVLFVIGSRPSARSHPSPLRSKGQTANPDLRISRLSRRFRGSSSPQPGCRPPLASAVIMSRRRRRERVEKRGDVFDDVDPFQKRVLPSVPTLQTARATKGYDND